MSLDIFHSFWEIPLDVASQDVFTYVTPDGLWKPTRMPQGCRNATSHFQGVMHWMLGDLVGTICAIYVDDIPGSTVGEKQIRTSQQFGTHL